MAISLTIIKNKQRLLALRYNEIQNIVIAIIDEPNPTNIQLSALNVFKSEVSNSLSTFHNELNLFVSNDTLSETDLTSISDLQREISNLYTEICACIDSIDRKPIPCVNSTQSSSHIRLPKLNLPPFDGNPENWLCFYNLYHNTIHNNSTLGDIEKFQYLLSLLRNEALSLVKSLPIIPENYHIAYNLLEKRYNNKRKQINHHVNKILDLHSVQASGYNSLKSIRQFISVFSENEQALSALDYSLKCDSVFLTNILLRKLDHDLRKGFEESLNQEENIPDCKDLMKFLESQCRILENSNLSLPRSSSVHSSTQPKPQFKTIFPNKYAPKLTNLVATIPTCEYCKLSPHFLYQCDNFKTMQPIDRHAYVKTRHLCYNCLSDKHSLKDCKSLKSCFKCKGKHHSLLHLDKPSQPSITHVKPAEGDRQPHQHYPRYVPPNKPNVPSNQHEQPSTNFVGISASSHTSVLLATVIANISLPDGSVKVQARGILDSAAQASYITEHLAQTLCVKRHRTFDLVNGISECQITSKGLAHLDIASTQNDVIASSHPFIILNEITSLLPRHHISPDVKVHFANLMLADPHFDSPGPIDFLLGADLYAYIFTGSRVYLGPHLPAAFHTLFGHVLLGSAPIHNNAPALGSSHPSSNVTLLTTSPTKDIHQLIQRFWEVESVPNASKLSPEEEECERHFVETHSRDSTGRYIVKLPFKKDPLCIRDSKSAAEKQFLSLERRFQNNAEYKKLYSNAFHDYIENDHMVKLELTEEIPKRHFFLPHHGVIKDSSTTPLRIVFNGSQQSANYLSLNNCMHVGPSLQSNIFEVITRFRFHEICFGCDIKQMYRNILVDPSDQNLQLLVWRDTPTQPMQVYKLTRVTFGLTSSPYLALRCLKQLAIDEGDKYPLAANLLQRGTFVDDILGGASSISEAVKLQTELTTLLKKGGFELRKWTSNSEELLNSVSSRDTASPLNFGEASQPSHSILGLLWDPKGDCFTYKIQTPETSTCTKRLILSIAASLWDPCGWLTPVTLWAKSIIQTLWTLGLTWDEPIPAEIAKSWNTFFHDLPNLRNLVINRCLNLNKSSNVELHAFSDASESGYAACIYIKTVERDQTKVNLLIAKSKVSPLKRLSIPRLELCAAHMAAKLLHHCKEVIAPNCLSLTEFAWSDSTIALSWIKTPPYKLKVFVANRVAEIQNLVAPHNWQHVISPENPADCGSRGMLPSDLLKHNIWWHGPNWLTLPHEQRPTTQVTCIPMNELPETKPDPFQTLVTMTPVKLTLIETLINKYSSWSKTIKVLAYLLRFISKCRKVTNQESTQQLSIVEIKNSTNTIVKLIQQEVFQEDINALNQGKRCTSKLQRLAPFIDSEGILRVGGRLKNSTLSDNAKHPIILPSSHPISSRLIDYYHIKYLHAGPQLLQSILNQHYWILNVRNLIRSRIFKCLKCFRNKPTIIQPHMGDLPSARISPTDRAFLKTGIDYAGPFLIKVNKLRRTQQVKIYLCVFVCLATKACHIEVVSDMTSDAFIATLHRFIARRGLCTDLYSDCGTNFVGAAAQLNKTFNTFLNQPDIKNEINHATNRIPIKFHFLPPAAPHMGGIWESAVKCAKYHLRRVLGTYIPTLEEFITLSTQIEAMMNSRPLTPISNDPSDLQPLTPGHFLIGSSLVAAPEPCLDHISTNRLSRWHALQAFNQRIWKRWSQEYLHTLQQRHKWTHSSPNICVGDLVIVNDPHSPPLNWPLGRVTKTFPGQDNVTRVVQIRTASGLITRPVVKVCPLK